MIEVFQTQFPPPNTDMTDEFGHLSQTWMGFFRALFLRTGSGTGVINTADNNLVATGTTQADALELQSDWNNITGGSPGGVLLPELTMGQSLTVFNNSGGNINMYAPRDVAMTVLGVVVPVNTPYLSTFPDALIFYYFSDTQIIAI